MTRGRCQPLVTVRDLDVLAALDYCPLTAAQLLKFSRTLPEPFTDDRRVRERLQLLTKSGRVRCRQYTGVGRSAVNYYTLSRIGHALLHGPDAAPPSKRAFGAVAPGHEHHTHCLAEFIVHAAVSAHEAGVTLDGFCRENSVCLAVDGACLYPDCAFQLLPSSGTALNFFVELDNCTERLRSAKDTDSWERKIRLYDAFQDRCPKRFRVLVVTTRAAERLGRILALAAGMQRNPQRGLFYGIPLPHFLGVAEALTSPCFLDHRLRPVSLIPSSLAILPAEPVQTPCLAAAAAAC